MRSNCDRSNGPARRPISCTAGTILLLSALLLSGCAAFSPDGGMSVVASLADETIHKDVISIRTEEDAKRAGSLLPVSHFYARPGAPRMYPPR